MGSGHLLLLFLHQWLKPPALIIGSGLFHCQDRFCQYLKKGNEINGVCEGYSDKFSEPSVTDSVGHINMARENAEDCAGGPNLQRAVQTGNLCLGAACGGTGCSLQETLVLRSWS